jgi:hypothetical protein
MVTILVSVLGGTFVCTENDEGPTSPEPFALSLALHGTITSVACHAIAGEVQLTFGGVRSTLIVKLGVEVLTVPELLVITASVIFALSVAAYVTTVVPSTVTGMLIDPLEPVSVPEFGVGRFAPVAV